MTTVRHAGPVATRSTSLQRAAAAVAAVFVIVGIAGFIPGITTHYSDLNGAGHHSMAKLLGIFNVSVLHNLVHLAFGVVGLLLARSWTGAKNFLIYGGAVYLVLWVYGLVIDKNSSANFVPVNTADNWLHFVLGVAMIALGVALGRRVRSGPSR